jgi:hypothetical protein
MKVICQFPIFLIFIFFISACPPVPPTPIVLPSCYLSTAVHQHHPPDQDIKSTLELIQLSSPCPCLVLTWPCCGVYCTGDIYRMKRPKISARYIGHTTVSAGLCVQSRGSWA